MLVAPRGRRKAADRRTLACLFVAVAMAFASSYAVARVDRSAHVPPPQDRPYPGAITIHVDASDTRQGIFRVHEVIPVKPGKLTLLFPAWIPAIMPPTAPSTVWPASL